MSLNQVISEVSSRTSTGADEWTVAYCSTRPDGNCWRLQLDWLSWLRMTLATTKTKGTLGTTGNFRLPPAHLAAYALACCSFKLNQRMSARPKCEGSIMKPDATISRRQFTHSLVAAGIGGGGANAVHGAKPNVKQRLKLGIDNFAVRAMGWKAKQLIQYAAKLKVDSLFITDLYAFESFKDGHLNDLRKLATDSGLQILVGSWSICETSTRFKDDWGTATEHLALGIRMAKALGSPAFRVVLGSSQDRLTEGGIDARIDDTVKVLRKSRSRCLDAGIKIAVENHAGDMHSLELVRLIEEAGKEFVGANMDSGNAVRTLEDPIENLKNLGPYVVTTSLRDTAVWNSENGVTAQWTAMGEGMVDWKQYFNLFAKLCPGSSVNIETISGANSELAVKQDAFWKAWPNGKPKGFDKFLAWTATGKPRDPHKRPPGKDRKLADQEYQRGELERSIRYCKSIGLGRQRD
jgi:sugar phosphate isomerase/epimerase